MSIITFVNNILIYYPRVETMSFCFIENVNSNLVMSSAKSSKRKGVQNIEPKTEV